MLLFDVPVPRCSLTTSYSLSFPLRSVDTEPIPGQLFSSSMMNGPERDSTAQVDPLSTEILNALKGFPEAAEIVLGGYFALSRYAPYRTTHDLDAWWRTAKTERTMRCIQRVMTEVAQRHGFVLAEREWGDTVSFELVKAERKIFSFQIALRTVELEEPETSEWSPILIEGLADNVGGKMNAVVHRGAPRDFLDIRELVLRDVASVEQCWSWWRRKNPGVDVMLAKAQALRHLEALAQRRPLESISDPDARTAARATRAWIRQMLLLVPQNPDNDR